MLVRGGEARISVPVLFLCFGSILLTLVAPASAEDCPPLTLITSVDLVPSENGREVFVPVTIAGADKLMLLDTGGAISELMSDAVDELKLPRRHGNVALYDISGHFSSEFTHGAFQLGRLTANDAAFIVAPRSNDFWSDKRIAGVLAPDILKQYDVHIDFGANKLSLLSQKHCERKVIYWPASAVAVVPMRVLASGHIIVPVLLDGHSLYALIDTGAYNTTLTIPEAEGTFNLKLGSPDAPHAGVLQNRPGSFTYKHVFHNLTFEGISVSNLNVEIIPHMNRDLFANRPETGTRIANPRHAEDKASMLIGMDVLRHFHLYIAYKEERLYITPVEAPAAKAATAGAAGDKGAR